MKVNWMGWDVSSVRNVKKWGNVISLERLRELYGGLKVSC